MNDQFIPETSRTPVVDFGPDNDWAFLQFHHFSELPAQLLGQQRSVSLDEPQISNVMHHSPGMGIKKHDSLGRLHRGRVDLRIHGSVRVKSRRSNQYGSQ